MDACIKRGVCATRHGAHGLKSSALNVGHVPLTSTLAWTN